MGVYSMVSSWSSNYHPTPLQGTFGEKPMWATTSLIDAMRTAKKGITLSNRWCIPFMLSYYIRLRLPCQGFSLAFLFLFLSANTLKVLIVGRVMPYVCHISIYLCDVFKKYLTILEVCYEYSYSFDPQSHYTDLYKCCQGLIWCVLKII